MDSGVSLYLHIPFCESKCSYCSFYSEPVSAHNTSALIDAMIKEVQRYDRGLTISTIYIGGGTPTCIDADQLCGLINAAKEHFTFAERQPEFTIEANPGTVSGDLLKRLYDLGANRLSIGAQSFDKGELDLLGRTHSAHDIYSAVDMAGKAGFGNISIDLIFAIPGSTVESLSNSLQAAIDLGIEHISAYSLSYEPGTPLAKALDKGEVIAVGEETDRRMYELAIETLTAAGFEHYEISNFARASFQCAHNLTYWANKPYIGIGPSAGSWFAGKRSTNIAGIDSYIKAIGEAKSPVAKSPSPIEIACETAVLNLRRLCGIDIAQFQKQTGFDPTKLFAKEIADNEKLGLLDITNKNISLTPGTLPIADSILADFSTV